jgi:hypothetical protein
MAQDSIPDLGIPTDAIYEPPELLTRLYPLGRGRSAPPSALFFRRELAERIQGFEESFSGIHQLYEDQAFLAKAYLNSPVYVSSECWEKYRVRDDSTVATTVAGRPLSRCAREISRVVAELSDAARNHRWFCLERCPGSDRGLASVRPATALAADQTRRRCSCGLAAVAWRNGFGFRQHKAGKIRARGKVSSLAHRDLGLDREVRTLAEGIGKGTDRGAAEILEPCLYSK